MIAVDTNLVVRLVVAADDPNQAARAKALIAEEAVFVPTTVLLETAWVLRSTYGLPEATIASTFRGLAGLPNLTIENPDRLVQALDWMEHGLDFADALHLASTRHCDAFATFDKTFVKAARGRTSPPVRLA